MNAHEGVIAHMQRVATRGEKEGGAGDAELDQVAIKYCAAICKFQ